MSAAVDQPKPAMEAVIGLMVIGEVLQTLGKTGTTEDGENVTAACVEWFGKQVSDLAGSIEGALRKMAPPGVQP